MSKIQAPRAASMPGRTGQKRSLGHRPSEGRDEDGMHSCLSSTGNSQERGKNCHIGDCAMMFSPYSGDTESTRVALIGEGRGPVWLWIPNSSCFVETWNSGLIMNLRQTQEDGL